MMSAIANGVAKPERFDLYVRKLRAICAMHGVEVGSRANLSGFMQKLIEDRHLAMDFWALISKLSDREGGELSDDQMLAVVVEGVTGGEPSDEDAEMKRIVDDLRAMLAGVDIQGPSESHVEPAPFPRSEAGQQQNDRQRRMQAFESALKSAESDAESRAAFTPGTAEAPPPRAAAAPSALSPQLDEEFLRRELTRLVQLYFESLDKNRNGSEPSLDAPASVGNGAGATTPQSAAPPRSLEGVDSDELTLRPVGHVGKSRLVLEPSISPAEDSFAAKDADVPVRVPLEDYSQRRGYGRAVLFVLVLGLCGAGFALHRNPAPFEREMSLLIQNIQEKIQGIQQKSNATTSSSPSAPPAAAIGDESPKLPAESAPQPAKQPPLQSNSTPPNAAAGNIPAKAASVGPKTVVGGVDPSSHKMTDRVAAQTEQIAEQISANGITNADLAGAVRVSPSTMEANLVESRVPAYPETAKIAGVEGPVVMQAIISRDGFVRRVHVIEGDSRLRSAATEAVSKWRYRPYLLSGQPVEVATTITVDFNLDRQ
jgi:TonB family protein